jgi:pSer/pThr/pTyr-binding forkhead associated (FHA) protein/tetratricopeptide (TPR) repeat protein
MSEPGLKLQILRDGAQLREVALGPELQIGRGPECGLRLDDRAISREHALLRISSGLVELSRQSRFGQIILNGRPVESATVKPGDVIDIGPFQLRLAGQAPAVPESPAPAPTPEIPDQLAADGVIEIPENEISQLMPPADLTRSEIIEELPPDAATKVFGKSHAAARLSFAPGLANVTDLDVGDAPVVIGRGKQCEVVLNDKKASRRHTEIEKKDGRYFVKDLNSVNGTFLNGAKVEVAELTGDDVIRIGDTEFGFKILDLQFARKIDQLAAVPDISHPDMMQPAAGATAAPVAPFAGQLADQVGIAGISSPGIPGGVAGVAGVGGLGAGTGSGGSLLARFKALPRRKQLIYAAVLLMGLWQLWDEFGGSFDPPAPKPNRQVAAKTPAQTQPPGKPTFDKLSEQQKKFVISQRELARQAFSNKEYDKALDEVRKIFLIVDDFQDAREIERYAIEKKKAAENKLEEERKKEEARRLAAQIQELRNEIQTLMDQKKYREAQQLFPRLTSLDPDNPAIGKWQAEIDRITEEAEAKERAKQTQEAINAEGWKTFQEGRALQKRNNCHSAIRIFSGIDGQTVTDSKLIRSAAAGIRECRERITSQVRPLLEEGKSYETKAEWRKAYSVYERVDLIDPGNAIARDGRDRIRKTLHDRAKIHYTEAVVAESFSDFDTAKRKFEECLATAPRGDIYEERARRKLNRFLSLEKSGENL